MQGVTIVIALSLLLCGFSCASYEYTNTSLGDRLIRTYTKYEKLPVTAGDARVAGWLTNNKCDPNLGVAYWFQSTTGPATTYPLTLYFTPAGQLAGVGVDVWGILPQNLIDLKFWKTLGNEHYSLTVSFRKAADMCSTKLISDVLGDRLIVNADTIAFSIPVVESEAAKEWTKGSCFSTMGHHWFYDVSTHIPKLPRDAGNLLPIVPMYTNGTINAFFFASTSIQQGIFDAHWWEPVPLANVLMCMNTCDPNCGFSGTSFWSTFHVYFRDTTQVFLRWRLHYFLLSLRVESCCAKNKPVNQRRYL